MPDLAIEAIGLTKSYGRVQALKGLDLQVRPGEIYGFLGPNGAGKTTTIRCLLDLIRPSGGSLRVMGLDPQRSAVEVRDLCGYLPGELSIEGNLTPALALAHFNALRSNQADQKYIRKLATQLDLDLSRPIRNLSRGNKLKVGVIQALMHRPRLLLLDEPTTGLDPLIQQQVLGLIVQARAEGATVFFSSHNIKEVEAVADRVAIISQGLTVEVVEVKQLFERALRRARVLFQHRVDPGPFLALPGVRMLEGSNDLALSLQITGDMDEFIKLLAKYPVVEMETSRPSLDEIFMNYYGGEKKEV